MARINLAYTVIRSPIDGTVVARKVDVGQTVAASLQAPTIFTIAQDLTKMQVYAKLDGSDVGRIHVGQAVTFKVDAFPKERSDGTVRQVRMNPTTVQNVVSYDAIVEFANPEMKLFPGMTAYVTIPVAIATDVAKLPNAALRFRPPMEPEEILASYSKHGIDTGQAAAPGDERASGAAGAVNPGSDTSVVWKLEAADSIVPVEVKLGITDHSLYRDRRARCRLPPAGRRRRHDRAQVKGPCGTGSPPLAWSPKNPSSAPRRSIATTTWGDAGARSAWSLGGG